MEKSGLLKNFENEYSLEIAEAKVEIETLKNLGLTNVDLAAEAQLRGIFGDKFIEEDAAAEDSTGGEKHIEKIGESDLSLNKTLTKQFEAIETDQFNTAVETVLL